MTRPPDACPRHQPLVEAALGADPSDEALERYAADVPTCPDCRRLLGIRLGVHPGRLDVAPPDHGSLHGMVELREALAPAAGPLRALRSRPAAWIGGLLSAAAVLAFVVRPPDRGEAPAQPAAAPAPAVRPSVVAVAPRAAPTPPAVRAGREPRAAASRPAPESLVARADDWEPPAFVDLRRGTAKGEGAGVDHVELIPEATELSAGGRITFTVAASRATELSLCVDGPERGVVWRGAVDAGATPLVVGDRALAYAFPVPGRYRFSLTADAGSCTDPAHNVWVEVR